MKENKCFTKICYLSAGCVPYFSDFG